MRTLSSTGYEESLRSLSIIEQDALRKHLAGWAVPRVTILSKLCRMGLLEPDPNTGYQACAGVHDAAQVFFERRG